MIAAEMFFRIDVAVMFNETQSRVFTERASIDVSRLFDDAGERDRDDDPAKVESFGVVKRKRQRRKRFPASGGNIQRK